MNGGDYIMLILLLLVLVVGIVAWVVSLYNFFVASKARIKASIAEIGNQLKRQADLIPNLEESAKGYLKHEKAILDKLAEVRKAVLSAVKSGDLSKMADAGSKVASFIPDLKVIVESNPQLQAAGVVTNLMGELRDTSDKVMYARRTLIDLTADYNVKVATFPSSLIAQMFHFTELESMKVEGVEYALNVSEEESKAPKVKL